jgi:hypothetical protein
MTCSRALPPLAAGVGLLALSVAACGGQPAAAVRNGSVRHAAPAAFVGTWTVVSRVDRTADGRESVDPSLGRDPVALLVYDAAGHVSAQLMRRTGRSSAGAASPSAAAAAAVPDANNSAALGGYDAYFGTYVVDTVQHTVTHRLEGALNPADVGRALTRRYRFDGAELVLEFDARGADGQPVVRTLRWRRAS